MPKPAWALPTTHELDTFLALTIVQRGAALDAMTPSRRIAYAVAYAKRDGREPYRVLDIFTRWQDQARDSLRSYGTPS